MNILLVHYCSYSSPQLSCVTACALVCLFLAPALMTLHILCLYWCLHVCAAGALES